MNSESRPRFLVVGRLSSRSGLGNAARNVVRVLKKRGLAVLMHDVAPGGGENWFPELAIADTAIPRGAITITVLGLDDVVNILIEKPHLFADQALNAGYFWWELTHIPPAWLAGLQLFDAQLAGSRFLQQTLEGALPGTPVLHMPHALELDADVRGIRGAFGIAPGHVVFLTTFDPASEPTRKNPLAAIDAFLEGTCGRADVNLMVRANTSLSAAISPVMRQVRTRVANDSRIVLIENSLPYSQVLGLIASCDVLISLHRSEGLGLPLLEAMALGKPVVATGWSGNLDFMSDESALLVESTLVPVVAEYESYRLPSVRRHACWAEPSVPHAAEQVARLAGDAALRERIGSRARDAALAYLQHAERAAFADELVGIVKTRQGRTRIDAAGLAPSKLAWLSGLQQAQRLEGWPLLQHHFRRQYDRHVGWRLGRP